MTSRAEENAIHHLRAALAPLSSGDPIDHSDDFRIFQIALERFIPSALAHAYRWWRYESLDAFRFAVARKVGPEEAELVGLCLLISDQTWTPFYLRLRISPLADQIEWFECKLGESGDGNGGMVRTPYDYPREAKLLHSVPQRLDSIPWAYTITRGSPPPG